MNTDTDKSQAEQSLNRNDWHSLIQHRNSHFVIHEQLSVTDDKNSHSEENILFLVILQELVYEGQMKFKISPSFHLVAFDLKF